jgi:hypothetical protein
VSDTLPETLDAVRPDLVIYNAGSDPFVRGKVQPDSDDDLEQDVGAEIDRPIRENAASS